MSVHYMEVCTYGYVHRQCRCISTSKRVTHINCNNPQHKDNPLNSTDAGDTTPTTLNIHAMSLNQLRDVIHNTAVDKGWWDGDERDLGTILMLCVSELAEALEEYRDGRRVREVYYRDGYNKPEGVPVELADTIIRILDFCGRKGIDIEAVLEEKVKYNFGRAYKHGGKVV